MESYQQLSAGLMRGLALLGLNVRADKQYDPAEPDAAKGPVCFEVPSNYEITAGVGGQPRKLLGSAQVRKRGVVLQHGTLPLHGDIGRICDALVFPSEADRQRAHARVASRAITVADLLGRVASWPEAAQAMSQGFAQALNLEFQEGALSAAEETQANTLRHEKYASETWTERV
jgi:lipoate-protein ligase A